MEYQILEAINHIPHFSTEKIIVDRILEHVGQSAATNCDVQSAKLTLQSLQN